MTATRFDVIVTWYGNRLIAFYLLACVLMTGLQLGYAAEPGMTEWEQAKTEQDPVRRRAADYRAAQAGSLLAMERLLMTCRFHEISLIDIRKAPFVSWSEEAGKGEELTSTQIHGMMLANWAFRNSFLFMDQGHGLMTKARQEMLSGPTTHPLLAMELAWHYHDYEPKDPALARQWFNKAKAWHEADTKREPWLHFCESVDLATVAVNNGYADVAFSAVEQIEKDAVGFKDPYALGMAGMVRGFLQKASWTGKQDLLSAYTTSQANAVNFAQADAEVMRAYVLSFAANTCLTMSEKQPERRQQAYDLFGECATIYDHQAARIWQANSLMWRGRSAQDFDQTAAELRLAMNLLKEVNEEFAQAVVTIWLIQVLAYYKGAEHHDEVLTLADALIPRMKKFGMEQYIPEVKSWRQSVIESRKALTEQ
jgi:hypothetical protein